jgi:sugar phosphate isomerase/epimerase
MAHKYSVVLITLSGSPGGDVWKNPKEVLETVAELGYDGVDLDAEPDRIPREKFDEVVNIATGLGLKIPALVGAWGAWHAGEERDLASTDEEGRRRAVDYAKKCLDLGATIGSPVYEICAAAGKPEYPVSSTPKSILRKNFIASAREITEHAEKTNTYVAIEAINRFEGHAGFLNAVEEALPIAEEIGSDRIGVLADLFHVNMEDGPVPETMRRAGKKLMHIHLADSNRQIPGTGHIDFLEMVRTLNEMNYSGYMSVDSVPPKPDWKTLLEGSITFMKQMEQQAELQRSIAAMN